MAHLRVWLLLISLRQRKNDPLLADTEKMMPYTLRCRHPKWAQWKKGSLHWFVKERWTPYRNSPNTFWAERRYTQGTMKKHQLWSKKINTHTYAKTKVLSTQYTFGVNRLDLWPSSFSDYFHLKINVISTPITLFVSSGTTERTDEEENTFLALPTANFFHTGRTFGV